MKVGHDFLCTKTIYNQNRTNMGKYLHKYQTEADFQAEYNGEAYLEPWVSYTTDNGDVTNFKAWCESTQHNYGAEYIGEENGYYKWHAYQIEAGELGEPHWDPYWTVNRNPEVGDDVFCSYNGVMDENPCAVVGEIMESGNHVDYNKMSEAITVEVYDGQEELANVTEYDDIDVPFEELMEPVFEAHGQRNIIRVVFTNGTEDFAGGDSCGNLTKADIEGYSEYSGTPAVPYDFDEEKFDEGMRGKTMRIYVSGTFC